jgi:hypothetical protein
LWKWRAFSQIAPPPPINKTSLLWQSTHFGTTSSTVWHVCYACQHCWRTSSTPGWLHRTLKELRVFPHNIENTRCF